jgi:hypothetical protein
MDIRGKIAYQELLRSSCQYGPASIPSAIITNNNPTHANKNKKLNQSPDSGPYPMSDWQL